MQTQPRTPAGSAAKQRINVTTDDLQACFALMRWTNWTFAQAINDPIRSRILRARAAQIRAAAIERRYALTTRLVRRVNPITHIWSTQRVAGPSSNQLALLGN